MSIRRQLLHGLRALMRRDDAYRDVSDEVHHYLEEAAAEHEARGLTREQALRAARLELGGSVSGVIDRVDSFGWENAVESVAADVRYAVRRLIAEPVFAVVTVLTLAIGIGSVTAMFSAVHGVLLRPLPYPDADRVVAVWDVAPDASPLAVTYGTFRELATRSQTLDELAVFKPWQPALSGVTTPERLEGQRVSAAYFGVLGVVPALGRGFGVAEDRPGGADEVILSDGLWRRQFAGDLDVVGRLITLDDRRYEVVGVMPPEFENVPVPSSELWALLQYDMSQGRAWGHHLQMSGRLRGGVAVDEAQRELGRIASTPVPELPRPSWAALGHGLTVSSLHDDTTSAVRPALLAMFGAAFLLLAIAGVNVTNLLVGRGAQRRGEFAVRAALGAGHVRLVRQLLTESLLLATAGGSAGIGVALLEVRALLGLSPPDLPRVDAISIDVPVFAFALGMTTLIGVSVGLIPALHAARSDHGAGIATGLRLAATVGPRARRVLVVAEVTLVVVLLVGSGLLLRSMDRLMAVDAGFEPSRLLTLQLQVSGERYDDEAIERFYDQALEAVLSVPGISRAAFTNQLPLSGDFDAYGVELVSNPDARPDDDVGVFRYSVTPDYGATMAIPLRRGRWFDDHDNEDALRVAVISESMARRRFSGIDPIGQRLRISSPDRPPFTIVGVVGDIRQQSLASADAEAVYTPASQWHFADDARSLVVRADDSLGSPDVLVSEIREAIWTVDPEQPIYRVATMESLVAASVSGRRFALILFEAFALASLILASAGIYGVLAANVAEKKGELGVRAALGASPQNIVMQVMREGLTVSAFGLLLGLAAAIGATQALVSLLYEVSRVDAVTYLGVVALVISVATLACAVPARRAAHVDPVAVLKEQG